MLGLTVRGRLYTSESDIYRHKFLTYKDGPRAERVEVILFKGDLSPLIWYE